MYEYRKLRGRITEKYGSITAFAKHIERSTTSVSNKLNCKSGFSQADIELWASALHIAVEDYPAYFFA